MVKIAKKKAYNLPAFEPHTSTLNTQSLNRSATAILLALFVYYKWILMLNYT